MRVDRSSASQGIDECTTWLCVNDGPVWEAWTKPPRWTLHLHGLAWFFTVMSKFRLDWTAPCCHGGLQDHFSRSSFVMIVAVK